MKPTLASIIICTRNRAKYLPKTIAAVAAQELPQGSFDILVIDNRSTDDTKAVVTDCQRQLPAASIRYEYEERGGLSVARNRAIELAQGEILCFLDDDAVPEAGWLQLLCAAYATDPRAMSVGGGIIPEYECALPAWFSSELEGLFKLQIDATELIRIERPRHRYPVGANVSFRAEVFRQLGKFDPTLGYSGRSLLPCEETELLQRIEAAGYHVLFEPRAIVHHIIPASRLTKEFFRNRYHAQGHGDAAMQWITVPLPHAGNAFRYAKEAFWWYRRGVRHSVMRYWEDWTDGRPADHPDSMRKECQTLREIGRCHQEVRERLRVAWKKISQS